MIPPWRNCTSTSPYEEDKVYVLLAVTTATLSLFLNLSQFVVILHQRLLTTNKNLLIINLCVCGQLSSASVLWYIHRAVLLSRKEDGTAEDDYLLCFLLPSGMHLLTIFTFAPLITLLVLQHHLVVRPKRLNGRFSNSHVVVSLLIVLAWCQAIIISLVPLTGWNNWHQVCAIPMAWSPSFSILVCIIYFLHYPMVIILLADMCLSSSKRTSSISPLETAIKIEDKPFSSRSIIVLLIMYMAGTLPFICYTASVALEPDMDLCSSLVANERAAMWTSWFTVAFAAVRPLFHVLMEDDLGDGTVTFITTVCRIKQ